MGQQISLLHSLFTPQSPLSINMQVLAVLLCCLVACQAGLVPATTLFRAPSHDSAVIRSDRLGGNFAYSVQEGHAYAAVSPVVHSYETPAVVPSPSAIHSLPAAPITLEAPKFEVKTVEVPKVEVKTVAAPAAVITPYGYGYQHAYPFAATTVALDAPRYEIKTVETPTAFKTLNLASPYYAPYAPFGHYGSYQIVEAAAPAEE